jgi:hypothetical protein
MSDSEGVPGREQDPRDGGDLILRHCVDALAEVFTFVAPAYMARVARIGRLAADLGRLCGVESPDSLIDLALLCQLGTLSLPEHIVMKMHRGELLTPEERRAVRATPRLGEHVLARMPGFEREQEVVRLHDVRAMPLGPLPVEAAILRVVIGFDRLDASGRTPWESIDVLRSRDPMYRKDILDELERYVVGVRPGVITRSVPITDVVTGMVLAADVLTHDGVLQLGDGHMLSEAIIGRLRILAAQHLIGPSIRVLSVRPSRRTLATRQLSEH